LFSAVNLLVSPYTSLSVFHASSYSRGFLLLRSLTSRRCFVVITQSNRSVTVW